MTFTLDWLREPTRIFDNRLEAHSDHRWFVSEAESHTKVSSFDHDLSGTWDFRYYPTFTALPHPEDLSQLATLTEWEQIPVPGHLQMHGYDRNRYVNTQYPWDGWENLEVGDLPSLHNPVGVYRRRFTRPEQVATDSRFRLVFEGAESAVAVWLNGKWVGYATDGFTPSAFDVTDLLVDGQNTLLAVVFMWHSGSWLEDQDFFRFAGLHRPVWLLEVPATHVEHLTIRADLNDDFTHATVRVRVEGVAAESITAVLRSSDTDLELSFNTDEKVFEGALDNPRLWSAEDPFLYDLTLTVRNVNGEITEVIPQKLGVRRFEIKDSLLLINGQRLVFKGVNRHEFGPNGRVVSDDMTTRDLLALKNIGCNAVRTSHYPNSSHLYAECDRLGLYVIDEMNLESHGVWDKLRFYGLPDTEAVPGDFPQWLPTLLDRAKSMLRRDLNHPSIIMWSCGNESYGGTNLLEVSNYFRSADDRPVHYEGTYWDPRYTDTTDVLTSMYVPAAEIEDYLRENREKPYIVCEYAHAMGNSFGAVDKYLDLARREPLFHGGFIWDFADQAVLLTDPQGKPYWGYGGDSGEAPHDAEFCGNGIFYADHSESTKIPEVRAVYAPFHFVVSDTAVEISSDLLFTASDQFVFRVTLSADGVEVASATFDTAVPALGKETYPLPESVQIPAFAPESVEVEYTLTVSALTIRATEWAPAGHEVAFGQSSFRYLSEVLTLVPKPGSAPARQLIVDSASAERTKLSTAPIQVTGLRVVDGIHNIGIHGERFSILFSKIYGGPISYRFGEVGRGPDDGRQLLAVPPRPCFWHAQTSNERGWQSTFVDGQWLLASRYARTLPDAMPTLTYSDNAAVVTYVYELPTVPVSQAEVAYAVSATGRIEVTVEVTPGDGLTDMPEFGVLLAAPKELQQMHWYGEGPVECYVDRRLGTRLGIHDALVADQQVPYLRPQESGNRTGVRWVEVVDESGSGLRFDCAGSLFGMEFAAQPYSPYEVENARHSFELPPVSYTWLRPALMRRGVGGDNSWGARTHPEFCLPVGVPLRFTFAFQGI
ncbi:Beta galactosidase small chain [Gleimia coleocanis DSM 15436]|uniref:Beta-galactosidase n=1 Tax=Gleimia coleocanis DSM 15436 TaxID=525245 RepID=C0VYR2_9ACTO|nr:glycoside hydrolase family 2 TIM barrel-domain containing protein [Gleimia coleocanis]EEH64565.1 Beta galactosidase small chain [Gleimia coleocanis DSM 15436]